MAQVYCRKCGKYIAEKYDVNKESSAGKLGYNTVTITYCPNCGTQNSY